MGRSISERGLLFVMAVLLLSPLFGCGRKGDPTLKSYEKPETPAGLSIIHREGAIVVSWAYPPSKEYLITDFLLLRSTAGGEFEPVGRIPKDQRFTVDRGVAMNRSYQYKVVSLNPKGVQSDFSAAASAAPVQAPARPKKFSYTITGDRATLTWEAAEKGSLFNVYRSQTKGEYGMKPFNEKPLTRPIFSDLYSPNRSFYYTVRSLSGSAIRDEGPASEELLVDASDLVPGRPADLQAFPAADRVFLFWKEIDERWIAGYRIYRKKGSGAYELIGQSQTPAFVDTEAPTSPRDYRVTAAGMAKEGPAAEIRDIIYTPQR